MSCVVWEKLPCSLWEYLTLTITRSRRTLPSSSVKQLCLSPVPADLVWTRIVFYLFIVWMFRRGSLQCTPAETRRMYCGWMDVIAFSAVYWAIVLFHYCIIVYKKQQAHTQTVHQLCRFCSSPWCYRTSKMRNENRQGRWLIMFVCYWVF